MLPDRRRLLEHLRQTVRRTDWTLVLAACLLMVIGIAFIWGAARKTQEGGWFPLTGLARKQVLWGIVGLAAMVTTLIIPYRFFARFGYTLYVLALGALTYVLLFGPEINYARRWIALGPLTVQPSEFTKVVFVIALAKYLRYKESYRHWWGLLLPFLVAGLPMLLVVPEPDLGSALVFLPTLFALLYAAGARKKHLLLYLVVPLAVLVVVWFFLLRPLDIHLLARYQQDRLLAFLAPERYARGPGYQLLQSLIAVGSGGLWGKGLGRGSQGQLGFLPARQTDFIFASVAEEWGFVGATVVLGLYLYLLLGGVAIARRTREPFGRLLVVGVMTLWASQALINTGMTVRLTPITGLPLPFVSYGGSSLVANFIALGLLLNVGARPEDVLSREDFQ